MNNVWGKFSRARWAYIYTRETAGGKTAITGRKFVALGIHRGR